VVDDYEPFRRFVCKTLGERQDTRVIDEVSDGLHVICQADELQPDLIVLDRNKKQQRANAALPLFSARSVRAMRPRSYSAQQTPGLFLTSVRACGSECRLGERFQRGSLFSISSAAVRKRHE
jgi:DNA-binding NarL/FixJ family response regulator